MSRRILPALLLFLTVPTAAQQPHPCDDRTRWTTAHDGRPISDAAGAFYAQSFDELDALASRVKTDAAVTRFLENLGVSLDQRGGRDAVDRADRECVAAANQDFFLKCDAALGRAYLGAEGLFKANGRWMISDKQGRAVEPTIRRARQLVALVCDKYDARRQAYALRLRREAETASARAAASRRDLARREPTAVAVAPAAAQERRPAAGATPAPAPPPAVQEASMISFPTLSPGVDPNDPRLQSAECRHLCEAYLAFGAEGCFSGLDKDARRWCEQKRQAVEQRACVCR